MNKKVIGFIVAIFVVVIGITAWFLLTSENSSSTEERKQSINGNVSENENVAIVYFSATGNTKMVAQYIQEETGGTLFEIEPEEKYTDRDLDYNNDDCRANEEQNDPSARPKIKNTIDLSSYDIVYLGYPIWWGDVPKIILTFLDETDLSGKTVIPFCTSGGSGIETSLDTLKNYNSDIHWIDGERLSTSKEDVTDWLNGLKY